MTDKTVSKFNRALCAGIAAAIVFSSFSSPESLKSEKLSLLFPQFIIGVSTEHKEDNGERIQIKEKNCKREYSFKIAELFQKLFG